MKNSSMKCYGVICFLLFVFLSGQGNNPKKLCFRENGEFKIAQFTDTHLVGCHPVFDMIEEILDSECPDLVMFTGDIVTNKEITYYWDTLSGLLEQRQIPWAFVMGNHDDEHGKSRKEVLDIVKRQPYCVPVETAKHVAGVGNYCIPVYSRDGNKLASVLYGMDSHNYSGLEGVDGYGWFDDSQIEWYRRVSRDCTKKNGGKPLPALAFFHIALPEYRQAWEQAKIRFGLREEEECAPQINSGMFVSMLECGDVMGTFVGHDHMDDYIISWHGIALAYGHFSGWRNTYGHFNPGARVIVLEEGKRAFKTWIREKGNPGKLAGCLWPGDF